MGDSQRCRKHVYGGSYMGHKCSRKAVKDGYCKQHHPDTVKAKRDERNAKWEKDWAERTARGAHEKAIRTFCAGFSTEALSKTSLAEVMNFLHEARQWIDLAEDMGRDNEDALRRADALLSLLKDSKS